MIEKTQYKKIRTTVRFDHADMRKISRLKEIYDTKTLSKVLKLALSDACSYADCTSLD